MPKYQFANNGLISGSIGTTTFQRNRIYKSKSNPHLGPSSYRQFQINCITNYSQLWHTLSQNDMDNWLKFHLNNKDRFANRINSCGQQSFISINSRLAYINNDNTIIHLSSPIFNAESPPLIYNVNSIITNSNYLITCDGQPHLSSVYAYSTSNLSNGRNKIRDCDFLLIGVVDLNPGFVDLFPLWNSRYSVSPVPGHKIFTKLIPTNSISGLQSPPFTVVSVVI